MIVRSSQYSATRLKLLQPPTRTKQDEMAIFPVRENVCRNALKVGTAPHGRSTRNANATTQDNNRQTWARLETPATAQSIAGVARPVLTIAKGLAGAIGKVREFRPGLLGEREPGAFPAADPAKSQRVQNIARRSEPYPGEKWHMAFFLQFAA